MSRRDRSGSAGQAAGGLDAASASGSPDAASPAPVRVTDRCAGCGACLLTCPQRAIRPVGGTLLVRPDLCDGCGECVEICPVDAIDEVPDADVFTAGALAGAGFPSDCFPGGPR